MFGAVAPALLDTNVLVYAGVASAPQHAACRRLLAAGATGSVPLRVTNQVLLEYFAVMTSPKRVTVPLLPDAAMREVAKFRAAFPLVLPPPDLLDRVDALVAVVRPVGAEIHDIAIAATMLAASVTAVYTYDRGQA